MFALSIAESFRNIFFFTTFLLVFKVDKVCNMSNKNQPPNDLAKCLYYYTRDFMSLLHFEIEIALSKSFSKLPLYTTFLLFLKWVRIIIFQINTDFLILQLFIQDTLHLSFISKKSLYSPSHKFLETSTFFITFWLVFTVEMVYNISNKY